jgi:hypothetical protein
MIDRFVEMNPGSCCPTTGVESWKGGGLATLSVRPKDDLPATFAPDQPSARVSASVFQSDPCTSESAAKSVGAGEAADAAGESRSGSGAGVPSGVDMLEVSGVCATLREHLARREDLKGKTWNQIASSYSSPAPDSPSKSFFFLFCLIGLT